MTATPIALAPRPVVDFDEAVLVALCDAHGEEAEAHLAERLGRIEALLTLAATQVAQDHKGGLKRTCADLAPLARTVGMRSVSRAADGVLDCLASGDEVALAACARRLIAMGQPDAFREWTVRSDASA